MKTESISNGANGKASTAATLDEAMILTGFGAYNVVHTLCSGLMFMGVITQSMALSYVIPAAQCDLDLTMQQQGWLAALPFAAIIVSSHLWGYLADTRGRRPVMLGTMLASVLMSILCSFSPNLATLAVLQFMVSFFVAGTSSIAYTYIGEFNSVRHRDKMVAFGASFVGIGTVLLPAIAWAILPYDFYFPINFLGIAYRPWRLLIVAYAVPYALSCCFLYFAPESPKFLIAFGKQEECLATVKTIYRYNKWQARDTFPITTLISESQTTTNIKTGVMAVLSSMKDQTVPLFKSPLLPWTCLTCFVQFGIFSTANGFYVWFPTILNSLASHEGEESRICDVLDAHLTADPSNTTNIICDDSINVATYQRSIYIGLIFSSVYIIVGFLVDLIGKKVILVVILCFSGLAGIVTQLVYDQLLAVGLFAVFQMCGACIGLMNAVSVELFPTKLRAMAISLAMMTGRMGSVAASNLIGLFLNINCGAGFFVFGGLVVLCGLLCLSLPGKNSAQPIEIKTSPIEPKYMQTHEPV